MKKIALLLGVAVLTMGAILTYAKFAYQQRVITQPQDYAVFLNPALAERDTSLTQQITFWKNRLAFEPNSGLYKRKVAGLLTEQFARGGDVTAVHQADSLLHSALEGPILKETPIYHALVRNAITQHDFQGAKGYVTQALATEADLEITRLLQFDVMLELGDLAGAKKALTQVADPASFDYQIRWAKIQDHEGDLPAAIHTMEQVAAGLSQDPSDDRWIWTMSNLADMYGHAGLVQKAYQGYLAVLRQDSRQYHALRGIAWIAFSHDQRPEEAQQILHFLKQVHPVPDYDLLLADIAEYTGNPGQAQQYRNAFIAVAQQPQYGRMYHSYLAKLLLEEPSSKLDVIHQYVQAELSNRPTVQSYLLLARYHAARNEWPVARQIMEEKVIGHSHEPSVLFEVGKLYSTAGYPDLAMPFLQEAASASFELGPLVHQQIMAISESI
ncbi:MAG: hypothetical protein H6555_00930 [Lewinellaceae bacterium]|nr:hypothetical protein [Lewinellaceae bacterium]